MLASATCKANIARARELIATPLPSIEPSAGQDDPDVAAGAGADYRPPCPRCGGRMIIVESFGPVGAPRTSRPALAASRGRDRNAMTPITASSQLLPPGNSASGIAALSPRRLRSHLLHLRSGQNRPVDRRRDDDPGTAIVKSDANYASQSIPYPSRRPVKSP